MKVLVIGDLSVSIEADAPRLPKAGENLVVGNPSLSTSGVAANISSSLSGLGIDTYVSGVVGRDVFGKIVMRELMDWGVRTRHILRSPRPTSVFMIVVDGTGQRTMIGYRGASETLHLDTRLIGDIGPNWVHISGYTLLNHGLTGELQAFVNAASVKASVSLDLEGVAYTKSPLPSGLTCVFCNLEEYRAFFRSEEVVSAPGPFTLVVKAGSKGCYLVNREGARRFKAFKTKVRDTNGAGDAFNAAFIYARLNGFGEEEACDWGNACGALKASQSGPHPKVRRKSLEEMLRGRR